MPSRYVLPQPRACENVSNLTAQAQCTLSMSCDSIESAETLLCAVRPLLCVSCSSTELHTSAELLHSLQLRQALCCCRAALEVPHGLACYAALYTDVHADGESYLGGVAAVKSVCVRLAEHRNTGCAQGRTNKAGTQLEGVRCIMSHKL